MDVGRCRTGRDGACACERPLQTERQLHARATNKAAGAW